MPQTLPSGLARKIRVASYFSLLVACRHLKDPPTTPGPPIPAQPEATLESMDVECAGLVAALDNYGKCPNLENGEREWARATIEFAEQSFEAGKKANPDEPS